MSHHVSEPIHAAPPNFVIPNSVSHLPSRFAILTDRPPHHLDYEPKCYAIINSEQFRGITSCRQYIPRANESTCTRLSRANMVDVHRWSVQIENSSRPVLFWFTGYYLDRMLVLDCDIRAVIEISHYTHSIPNDTIIHLISRQSERRELRRQMLDSRNHISAPNPGQSTSVPPAPRVVWPSALSILIPEFDDIVPELVPPEEEHVAAAPIPRFVAEAMKRDAIATGASCPITTSTFETETRIAITPCYHLFEEASLKQWTATNRGCPICKGPITSELMVV